MATKQISALNPKPTAVAGTDKFGIDDVNSVSWRVSASSVLTYFLGNLPAGLVSIGNLNTNSNMMIYTTATNTYATTTITAFGRTFVASVDATSARTSLGLGTAAVKTASGSGSTVASISGSVSINHVAVFSDTAGTLKDGGTLIGVNSWTTVTGTTQAMSVNSGYTANSASQIVFTLPSISAPGDVVEIQGYGAGGWKITYGTGQQIIFGNAQTTLSTGSLASTNQYDGVLLRCAVANTIWTVVVAPQGNLDVL